MLLDAWEFWINWKKIAVIQEGKRIRFVSVTPEYEKFIAKFNLSSLENAWALRDKFIWNVQKRVQLIKAVYIYPFSQFP